MEAVIAGEGTKDGQNGADYWMKYIADLPDYYSTRRNGHRLLWSNDGLLFVTYNHYEIFLEII